MAKLVFSNLVSLDGYFAGPDGDLSSLPMGSAFDQHNLDLLRTAGTVLFGRTTFEMFQSFWPDVLNDSSADPVVAEIATLFAKVDKLVLSDKLSISIDAPWREAKVIKRLESHAYMRALKVSAKSDVVAYGSHMVMNDLLAHGLVDEIRLLIANVVLLDGVRLFKTRLPAGFSLIETRRLPGSDIAMLRYACHGV
jgi:dihydrofolate reductase